MLDEQDARPAFDIHQYGDQILDKLAGLSCKDPSDPAELEQQMVRTTCSFTGSQPSAQLSHIDQIFILLANANVRQSFHMAC